MHWLYLFGAILFEVAGTLCMKYSDGFSRLLPSVLLFVFYGCTFALITLALKKIELSIAYTIWAGVGTTLIALIGIFYFGESSAPLKLASIGLVILGVIGLKVASA